MFPIYKSNSNLFIFSSVSAQLMPPTQTRQPSRFPRKPPFSSGIENTQNTEALSRALVRVLRHKAEGYRLQIREDGYVPLDSLLRVPEIRRFSPTLSQIKEIVRDCPKQRLALCALDGELHIRANQAHSMTSVKTERLLRPIESAEAYPVVVHGTFRRNLRSIRAEGLKKMGRNNIHLTQGGFIGLIIPLLPYFCVF